jgi:CHAT domain-containing protein
MPVLDEAIELYRQTDFQMGLPLILGVRARANRTASAPELAEIDLGEAARMLEKSASAIEEPRRRASFRADSRPVYDEIVDLQIAEKRPRRALVSSEMARSVFSTSSAERAGGAVSRALELPDECAVLVYHALPGRLVIWVLRGGRLTLTQVAVGRAELSDRAAMVARALRIGERPQAALEAFYRLLIAPVAHLLGGSRDLVIVADEPILGVPFAALRDPDGGRYLVQDRRVMVARSVAGAEDALRRSSWPGRGVRTGVLAIGNPALDPALGLPSLLASEEEVERIATNFPETTLLVGEAATVDGVLELLGSFEVVHFAGHVLSNRGRAGGSSLVLSPSGGGEGLLGPDRLVGAQLAGLRLFVISGCGSGLAADGAIGLANALQDAGVPMVIASLWDVSDRSAKDFFAPFYLQLKDGSDPYDALRASQLGLLASSDPLRASPSTWGVFQAYVGSRAE